MILLAASLNKLTLAPGQPLPTANLAPQVYNSDVPGEWGRILLAIFRVIMLLAWIVLPLYLLLFIFSKKWRKRILRDILTFLPILFLVYLLSTAKPAQKAAEDLNPGLFSATLPAGSGGAPVAPPVFNPPPEWATTVTTIVLAVFITLVIVVGVYAIWRRSHRPTLTPLQRVEQEAQAAIDAINAGGDLRDAILRCYYQMVAALQQYRNIQRGQDVTPHEFEVYLTQHGLPKDPVHQLTQLFEQVRYGGRDPGRREERVAVDSLNAIVSACQRGRA